MTFHLYHSTHHPLILGYPWLKQYNPQIDWATGRVLGWGKAVKRPAASLIQLSKASLGAQLGC